MRTSEGRCILVKHLIVHPHLPPSLEAQCRTRIRSRLPDYGWALCRIIKDRRTIMLHTPRFSPLDIVNNIIFGRSPSQVSAHAGMMATPMCRTVAKPSKRSKQITLSTTTTTINTTIVSSSSSLTSWRLNATRTMHSIYILIFFHHSNLFHNHNTMQVFVCLNLFAYLSVIVIVLDQVMNMVLA